MYEIASVDASFGLTADPEEAILFKTCLERIDVIVYEGLWESLHAECYTRLLFVKFCPESSPFFLLALFDESANFVREKNPEEEFINKNMRVGISSARGWKELIFARLLLVYIDI